MVLLILLVVLSGAARQEQPLDLLIRGCQVIDGTGAPARRADVGVRGDTIVSLGDVSRSHASRVVDASGLTLAPGFIDMHSHSDYTLLVDARGLSKITQGVTTELLGEAGSAGPALGPARAELEQSLARLELQLDWTTLGDYFRRLERQGTSVNVLSTVGSGQVRASVTGYENRPATPEEFRRMEALVDEAMRDGAVGLSSGLIYPPNMYASTEELIVLARVAARHGGIYVSHIRDEDERLLEALEEAVRIGREAGLSVEVLHFKRSGVRVAGGERPRLQDAIALVENAQRDGVRIFADVYPYAASQTTLGIRLPDWVHEGGREKTLARLRDAGTRARIRAEIETVLSRGIAGSTPDTIMLGATPYETHRPLQGKRIAEIASALGIAPAEAIIELIEKAEGRAMAIYFGMREEDVRRAVALPWTTFGSDGTAIAPEGILARGHPHPRWYGTFPRILGRYVREEKLLTLPEAIRKMTSLPASRLGLSDRGVVAEGKKADLVVFDPATIIDRSTFSDPHQLSSGVRWLVVNGQVVLDDGRPTAARPGRILRRASRRVSVTVAADENER